MATNPNMHFDEEEDAAIPLQGEVPVQENVEARLSLVGRFLTRKPIRIAHMKDRLSAIWQPGRGVNIRVLDNNLFLFQFFHSRDVEKISGGGPWHFDGHMLILSRLGVGDVPTQVPLFHVAFWVQVYDVPIGFMTESVGRVLGNFIGEFLEYDPKNSSDFWKLYMRIRVLVDVRKPLRRGKKINVGGDNIRVVKFKYERLSIFCYLCGALGYLDSSCDLLFKMKHDDGSRGWGPELKVERRTPGEGNGWLRNEGGGPASAATPPNRQGTTRQPGVNSNNDRNNCEEQLHALNLRNIPPIHSTIIGDNHGDINVMNIPSNIIMTEINMRNVMSPASYEVGSGVNAGRVGPRVSLAGGVVHRNVPSLSMEVDGDEEEEARKRKRSNLNTIAATTNLTEASTSVAGCFLLAGPGSQACQDK